MLKTEINSYHIDGDHLTLDGVCEEWFEILWTRRFFKGDDFTITLPPTARNVELFSEGKVIELAKVNPLTGASEHAGVITSTEITSGEKAVLTVSGQNFVGLLDRRILSECEYDDTAMTVFRKNAGDLANAKRRFAATTFDMATDTANYNATRMLFKSLAEYAASLAANVGWGLQSRIAHDKSGVHIVIGGRNRVDRSISQTDVKRVIFSDEYDTASDFERRHSDSGAVTGVVVGSKSQHNDNTHVDIEQYIDYFGDTQSYGRIEKYQSITPVTKTEMRGNVGWTVLDDWGTYLAAKDLSETCYVSSTDCFGADVVIRDNWESKFAVGDVVTVQNTAWNAVENKQVTEIREYWGADSTTVTATLGEPQKTLSEIIGGGSSGGSSGGESVGSPGVKGDKGDPGEKGEKGDTGETGPQGPKGDTGATGPQGPQGPKGDKGDTGAAGAAAGFGTPTATVDANTGTPSVTVTATGADTAKVFNFAFKNLKGAKGDTGAKGDKGDKGEQGDPATNYITGVKGDTESKYRQGNVNLTAANIGAAAKSHSHTKSDITDFPTSMPANGGNADTVNGHTVNSDVPANAKFTDTTYSNATTSKAGLMSAADKTKLDETRLWRRCVVGQSSGTTTNPYYKFASISLSNNYADAAITFKVSLNYVDRSTYLGILTAHVRTSGAAYWESSELVWEYALGGIDTSKFILCHNTSAKPTVVELWVKVDRGWSLYHFDVLTEGTRTTSNNSLWTLYNKSSAGSEAALPSGYVQQTSTLGTIKNSISGNAATASKLTTSAGSTSKPVYFKDGKPVECSGIMSSSSVAAVKTKLTSFKSNFEIL